MTPWLLALVLLWSGAPRARADEAGIAKASASAADALPFFPGAHEQARSEDRAAARELERLFSALPQVAQARVAVSRTDPSLVPLDAPIPAPKLTVLLQVSDSGPDPGELSAVLDSVQRATSPPALIEVIQTRAAHAPVREQPHQPTRQHETPDFPLRTLLAISLAANVLLATVLLLRTRARGAVVSNSASRGQ